MRPIIFYHLPVQKEAAESSRDVFRESTGQSVRVEILPAAEFWTAEGAISSTTRNAAMATAPRRNFGKTGAIQDN